MNYAVSIPSNGNYLVAIGLEGVAESIDHQVSEMSEIGKKHRVLEAVTLNSEKHQAFWVSIRDFSYGMTSKYPNAIVLKSNILISKSGEMLRDYEKMLMNLQSILHSSVVPEMGFSTPISFQGKIFGQRLNPLLNLLEG